MDEFMRPFKIKMMSKYIELDYCYNEFDDLINGDDVFVSIDQDDRIKEQLCTDYKIYESIFFHLMQNAIKYSPVEGTITVKFAYKPEIAHFAG